MAVCEGQKTEPGYFRSMVKTFRAQIVEIEIIAEGADPWAVVEKAIERKRVLERIARRSSDNNDKLFQVWAVFDVDTHARFADACDRAHATGIQLAISNPCFELWAIYHFEDCDRPMRTADAIARLSTSLPGYRRGAKTFTIDRCGDLAACKLAVKEAIARAERSLTRREQEQQPLGNPSSTCGRLARLLFPD